MPKFDDFDLDIKAVASGSDTAQPRITSYALCTPGTCHDDCKPTAWLCSNACVTKTCATCA